MPGVRLECKTAVTKKNIVLVLNLLDQAICSGSAPSSGGAAAAAAGHAEDLLPDQRSLRYENIFGFALKKIEKASGKDLGADQVQLELIEIQMDAFAKHLFDAFRDETLKLLRAQKISYADIINHDISNHYILIREILLRLIAKAFDKNSQPEHKESLIEISATFLRLLRQESSQPLTSKGLFSQRTLSALARGLFEGKNNWIAMFRGCAELSSAIHANQLAIDANLKLLSDLEYDLQCQMLVCLAPSELKVSRLSREIDQSVFHRDIIRHRLQDELLSKNIFKLSDEGKPIFLLGVDAGASASAASASAPASVRTVSKEVQLGPLMKRLEQRTGIGVLQSILERVASLIPVFGWLPIVTGALDFTELAANIHKTATATIALLDEFKTEAFLGNQSSVTTALFSHRLVEQVRPGVLTNVKKLESLTDNLLIQRILSYADMNMRELLALQKEAGIEIVSLDFAKQFLSQGHVRLMTRGLPDPAANNIPDEDDNTVPSPST